MVLRDLSKIKSYLDILNTEREPRVVVIVMYTLLDWGTRGGNGRKRETFGDQREMERLV